MPIYFSCFITALLFGKWWSQQSQPTAKGAPFILRVIACSIRGDVKNILLPPPEARLWFAASSPLSDRSDARVLCLALWFRVLLCSISTAACSLVATTPNRFLKLASTRGCTVSTMVLSATRGLVLFRVIREGMGLTQRLSATGALRLQAIRMLTLEPERLKNPTGH